MTTVIRSEPRVYEPHGDHSFFLDHAVVALGPGSDRFAEADGRLVRHMKEIDTEIRERSPEGVRAERVIREMRRAETRATTSISSSLGAFVTPQYLTELFPVFRSADRNFTNQCRSVPLPPVGLTVYVPSFTAVASAGKQVAETGGASGVSTGSPTGADENIQVVTETGSITISQQLFDRGGFAGAGGGFDQIAIAQINSQLDAAVDSYVLTRALATAGTVTESTTATITLLFTNLSAAREKLTDTAGVRLAPTHVFTTSDLAGWITKQVDTQKRPIFLPTPGALVEAADRPEWSGWLGICLPGALRWFADDNIPVKGSNTRIIVARPSEMLVWEGEPLTFAYPETLGQNLSVVVGLRKYLAAQPRHAKAIAQISGNGYPTTLK